MLDHAPRISTADALPEISPEEDEQLDFALDRRSTTRLACCIPIQESSANWDLQLPRF
jgi:hypothetical protein